MTVVFSFAQTFEGVIEATTSTKATKENATVKWYLKNGNSRMEITGVADGKPTNSTLLFQKSNNHLSHPSSAKLFNSFNRIKHSTGVIVFTSISSRISFIRPTFGSKVSKMLNWLLLKTASFELYLQFIDFIAVAEPGCDGHPFRHFLNHT